MGAKTEQAALVAQLQAAGATWMQVAGEFRERWGLNARQAMRIARGMSQREVAAEWCKRWPDEPKSDKNVSTWELWPASGYMPSLIVLDRLARIYRCSVADLVADFEDYGKISDDGDVDRRTVLAGLGGSLASATIPGLRHRRVAPELADYFDRQLRSHYQADMLAGPHLVLDTVTTQFRAIRQAVDAATGPLHVDLLRIAASYAALAGWLYQDAGDLATSSAWRTETLDLAHRSGDPHLVSYALTNRAMLRVEVGDGIGAVDLANAALADERRLAPKVRILALVQAAQGHSLVGERGQAERALDDVAALVDRVDDDWPWGNAFRRTPGYLDAQRATCFGRLGMAAEASGLWSHVIRQQPPTFRRDSGVYLARHASALLEHDEPAEASHRAGQAVACLHETGSARMRLELARLRDKARRWRHTATGRELIDVLDEVA